MELTTTPHRAPPRRRRRLLVAALVGVLLALAALVLAPTALGLDHVVVRDDAMGPAMGRGALALTRVVPGEDIRAGDVVRFTPLGRDADLGVVTRRVESIEGGYAVTRGTTAARDDPWTVEVDREAIVKVEVYVPLVGNLLGARPLLALGGGLAALALLVYARLRRLEHPAVEASSAVGRRRERHRS